MTEYTSSPEAIEQWMTQRDRTRHWISSSSGSQYPPSLAPSVIEGTVWDEYEPSECGSSHSIPPTMMLRYADNRQVLVTPDGYDGKHRRKHSAEQGPEAFSTRSLSPVEPISSASASDSRSRSRGSVSPSQEQQRSHSQAESSMRRLPSYGPEAIVVLPPAGPHAPPVASSIVSREHSSSSHSHSQSHHSHSREYVPSHRSQISQLNSGPHAPISPVIESPPEESYAGTVYPPLPSSHPSHTPTQHAMSIAQNGTVDAYYSQSRSQREQEPMIISSRSPSQVHVPTQLVFSQSQPQSHVPSHAASSRSVHRRSTHPLPSTPSTPGRPLPIPGAPKSHSSQFSMGQRYPAASTTGPSVVYAPARRSNMDYQPPQIFYSPPSSRKSAGNRSASGSVAHASSPRRSGNGTPFPGGSVLDGRDADKYGTARAADASRISSPKRSLFSIPFRPGSAKSSVQSPLRESRPGSTRSRFRSTTVPIETPRSQTPDSMYSRSSVSTYYVLPKRGQKVHVVNPDTRSIHDSYNTHSRSRATSSPTPADSARSAHHHSHYPTSQSSARSTRSSWFMRPFIQRFFTSSPQHQHQARSESYAPRYRSRDMAPEQRYGERRDGRRDEGKHGSESRRMRVPRRNSSDT